MSALRKLVSEILEGKVQPTEKDFLEAAEALVSNDPSPANVLILALTRENVSLRTEMKRIQHAHVSQKELREMRELIWECSTYHSKC